jgi:hypothetical protein
MHGKPWAKEEKMSIAITVEARTIGQKNPSDTSWEVFINQGQVKYTLRELIACVVQEEVNFYNQKYHQNRLSPVLSFDEIEQGKADGKIGFSNKSNYPIVDSQVEGEKAVKAFRVGQYYVFVDDVQVNDLDDEVVLKSNSIVVFIRLMPLRGG